jgi:putative DNA primase/helicase
LLNCLNGTIDLKTGTLQKHNREDLITKLAPVKYDENAKCPIFDSFLAKIANNDPELMRYLQHVIGYALTGDVTEKAVFFLHGDGNNGKTTFLEVIRTILDDYAGQVPIDSLMVKRDGISNDIARLQGRRFVTSSEAEQGKKLAESKVKQLTGMGTLQARYLYGEYFEFRPTFKIFMDANYKPEIRGTDPAIWNRVKLIPFTVEIPAVEIDKKMLQKLKDELPGILAWAVRGCVEWQQHGLKEPKSVAEATQAYREEMDTVARFLEEECVFCNDEITSKELNDAYGKWCKEHGEEAVSQKQRGSALKKGGLQNIRVAGQRGWRGIGLKVKGSLFLFAEAEVVGEAKKGRMTDQ